MTSKAIGVLSLEFEKLPPVRVEIFSEKETQTIKPNKKPACLMIGVWFDCGGSHSSTHILSVLYPLLIIS